MSFWVSTHDWPRSKLLYPLADPQIFGVKDGRVPTPCAQDPIFNCNAKNIIKIRARSIVIFDQIGLISLRVFPLLGRLTYLVIPTASDSCLFIFVED